MRLLVAREPLRRMVQWAQRVLMACAASLLAYCAYVAIDTWHFQKAQRRQFESLLATRIANPISIRNLPPPVAGGLIGLIAVPRLGLSVMVAEGASSATLRRAAGHISGTALPGQSGNVGISAHRDTFFRPLRNIRRNDIITLTTLLGEYRYRVVSTKVVSPEHVEVLDPSGTEVLTLVTCYPFYFVGAAPSRFIVRAERVI